MTQTSTTITVDSLPVANSIDPVQDRTLIYTASATDIQGISRNTYLGLSSQPVGINDSQTLTTKTLDNSNVITIKDSNLTLQNASDVTKVANFSLSAMTTGTTKSYLVPNISTSSDTLVGLAATQTLTNKTLTSPAITGGSIDNSAVTVDTIAGHTTSNTGTIYGIPVTTGTLGTTALAANAVQANQLATNALSLGYAQITTNFTTTSATAVQVTGLTATVTIPAGGRKIKITAFASDMFASASATFILTLWDGTVVSGTQLARALANNGGTTGVTFPAFVSAIVTPSAGSKTYNVGFQTSAGTGTIEAAATYPAYIHVEGI